MGSSYHQFCPVAKAMELLDERWTLLIVRELVCGPARFNDLRRGLPRMSPTLLSRRLSQLTNAGVVDRRTENDETRYTLTQAGHELRPVVEALAVWGIRWIGELGDEDLDPKLLLWDMHRNVDQSTVPPGRTVIQFRFPDIPPANRYWWLVISREEVDVCDTDPGHDVSITVTTDLRSMIDIWRGNLTWSDALRANTLTLNGPEPLRRAVPGWFTLHPWASVPRPATTLTRSHTT